MRRPDPIPFRGPFLGLNTTAEIGSVTMPFARQARNVLLSEGLIRPRAPWRKMLPQDDSAGYWFNTRIVGLTTLGQTVIFKLQVTQAEGNYQLWAWKDGNQPKQIGFPEDQYGVYRWAEMFHYNGWVYILDGNENEIWKTDGNKTILAGIPQPTEGYHCVFAASVAGGALDLGATYGYVCTLYDPLTNVESNYVTVRDDLTIGGSGANRTLTFTAFDSSTLESWWTWINTPTLRLYRRNHTRGEIGYRLVSEHLYTNQIITISDGTADDALTLSDPVTGPFAPTRNHPARHFNLATEWNQRVFYGRSDEPGKLWFSAVGSPDYVHPDDWLDVSGDTDDVIRGLLGTDQHLYVGKKTGILTISGSIITATNETVATGALPLESSENIDRSRSKVGPDGIGNGFVLAGGFIHFPNRGGFFRFDGLDSKLLSDLIEPTWREFYGHHKGRTKFFSFCDDVNEQILYICNGGQSIATERQFNDVLAYHYAINRGDGVGCFTTLDSGGTDPVASGYGVRLICAKHEFTTIPDDVIAGVRPLVLGIDIPTAEFRITILVEEEHPTGASADYNPDWSYRTGALEILSGRQCKLMAIKWIISEGGEDGGLSEFAGWIDGRVAADGNWGQKKRHHFGRRRFAMQSVRRKGSTFQLEIDRPSGAFVTNWDRRRGILGWELHYVPVGQR